MGDDKIIRPVRVVMIDKDGNKSEICGTVDKVTVEPETVERDNTLFNDKITSATGYSSECTLEIKSITRKNRSIPKRCRRFRRTNKESSNNNKF